MYAAGKIPGSFFRREGRPSTDAILTCRLIDRPLRPSFVKGLRNEVQVVITVMALNPDHQYDVLAINAASMSTQLSGLPFSGPIGGVRVALIDGQWVAFPNHSQMERAVFDMVVAGRVVETANGSDVAIMMVEAEATENAWPLIKGENVAAPTEEVVAAGPRGRQAVHRRAGPRAGRPGRPRRPSTPLEFPTFPDYADDAYAAVEQAVAADLEQALQIAGKAEREGRLDEIKAAMVGHLAGEDGAFEGREKELSAAYRSVQKKLIRQRILRDDVRIDGRGLSDIRQLSAEVEVVPRVHGSALFERGETQILGITTLNMLRMEQQLDTLSPETRKRYMHNYNFPPFSTGETGRVGSPKRREIGHGALAERALMPVLPSREEFPYAIRQVSEALSSNGSTSMGSVCASTLALLNAGVPLNAPVAGIAMGLVSDPVDGETRYAALTDILGAEDAFGDMDFKVAGTKEFVTAIQLDTKLDGIPASVLASALTQARDARLHILDVMAEAIDAPDEMSPFAPRVIAIKVPVDKIGEVIGPKGKMINQIQDETGAQISIEDDGTVYIGATDGPSADAARNMVNAIANPQMPEVGERFLGTVVKTTTFGAFISLLPGKDGLLHISEIRKLVGGKRIDSVEDVLAVGQKVQVELKEIDPRGKLSLAAVLADDAGQDGGTADVAARRGAGRGLSHTLRERPVRAAGAVPLPLTGELTSTLAGEAGDALVRRTVLPGGVRVLSEHVPGVRSVTLGCWVGVGSRDEAEGFHGATHFLEHLLFKGTTRRSALDIAVAFDTVGGEANAVTGKEHTCYYARVLDDDLGLAGDVITDMVTSATLRAEDVDAERGVILEELAMNDDDPADVVHERIAEAVLGDHPLGRPIGGTAADHRGDRRRARAGALPPALHLGHPGLHRGRQRRPRRPVPAARGRAGPLRHRARRGPPGGPPGRHDGHRGPRRRRHRRRPAADRAGERHPRHHRPHRHRRAALRAVGAERGARRRDEQPAVPGGAREARPGLLGVLVRLQLRRLRLLRAVRGLHAGKAKQVVSLMNAELERIAEHGVDAEELARGIGQMRGGLVLGMEDTGSRMTRLGKAELVYGEYLTMDDVLARIEAVSADEVRAVAADLAARPRSLAVVGPFDEDTAFGL